ncbi:hypothetical protein RclHR1_15030001 [Rhizophagus clarus]|uniref:Protein kinase domain-containing protein n=1 Tax=Rhizophagus clarus TaxID=94130 RepID=A0A2Z6QIJ5_9GLOM|nr:hypothetical protein RclHR1_15030001 [Rhizophagus clarus]
MSLSQLIKAVSKKCKECNKKRKIFDVEYQICYSCHNLKTILKPEQSGNKVIDDFIRYTQINHVAIKEGKMEFVSYDQFKNIEFIAEGGFSKVYKATWINGPIFNWNEINRNSWKISRWENYTVVLKKLNNSKNITSKELNELQIFYQIYSDKNVYDNLISEYFGITQDPITKDIMIIMEYYSKGDLLGYLNNKFYNISWYDKLHKLFNITDGLKKIFQGQRYTKASDIYSVGMFMWEFMTGRRPFWNRNHDTDLIINICDGLQPSIVTNAPDGYIELMKECRHSDLEKRPTAKEIHDRIWKMYEIEVENFKNNNPTKIIESLDIGPVTTNHSGAIYKSRPLSGIINSAMSIRSSRSVSINLKTDKRKFADLINDDNGQSSKRKKLRENEFNDYLTNEIELDIDVDMDYDKLHKPHNKEYVTKEFEFDIDINNS